MPMAQPLSGDETTTQDNEESKLKMYAQELRDENRRLKARLKMQETELIRKERAIDDFYQQNQFI